MRSPDPSGATWTGRRDSPLQESSAKQRDFGADLGQKVWNALVEWRSESDSNPESACRRYLVAGLDLNL